MKKGKETNIKSRQFSKVNKKIFSTKIYALIVIIVIAIIVGYYFTSMDNTTSTTNVTPGGGSQCIPKCVGKSCGSDGCGGSCGACPTGRSCDANGFCYVSCTCSDGTVCGQCAMSDNFKPYFCSSNGAWIADQCNAPNNCPCPSGKQCNSLTGACESCTPNCAGKVCGSDGCGGSCGACSSGQTCSNGQCVSCLPNCAGKDCGSNGCGGICGTCPSGYTCDANGQCAANAVCNCGAWQNGACGMPYCETILMRQTRTCDPVGCVPSDGQGLERCYPDSLCIVPDSCSDTDGGNKPNVLGNVTGYQGGYEYFWQDYCLTDGSNKLTEWYCIGTSISKETIQCQTCKDGVCTS